MYLFFLVGTGPICCPGQKAEGWVIGPGCRPFSGPFLGHLIGSSYVSLKATRKWLLKKRPNKKVDAAGELLCFISLDAAGERTHTFSVGSTRDKSGKFIPRTTCFF